LKKRFFDNVLDKKLGFISQTTYKDNIFIDEAAKAVLENLMNVDYYYYTVYCLGQWGNRSGTKVFFNLSIHDFDFGESLYKNRRGGLDFGFNHAQALIRSGYIDGELYIYREIWKKGMLNKDFISEAEKVWEKDFPINAESANPDKITEWLNAGYMVNPVKKGPNSLKMGVDFLKAIPKIHINKTSCPNCANEFDKFKYRQYKDGRISDNEYVEIDDDTVAATRYANEEFFINGVEEGAGNPVYLGRLY
jgi:phage terminase large subunit